MQYRRSFLALPKPAQDRDLLCIFVGSAEGAIQEESTPKGQNKKKASPTNSNDEVEAVGITASNDTEDAEASSHHQEVTSPFQQ